MSKRRLNWQRLQKQPALKKQIAMFIAQERFDKKDFTLNVVEVLAFGYKERPLLSYSEKDLVKMFDDISMDKVAQIEAITKEMTDEGLTNHHHDRWKAESFKRKIDTLNKELEKMQPIMTALIEEAFSD